MKTQIKITILGHEALINFPTAGQIMDIESMKMALTNGTYGSMVRAAGSGSRTTVQALDLVDAVSHFAVLVPELRGKLKIDNYTAMPMKMALELTKTYKKEYAPWFAEVEKDLYEIAEEAAEENEELVNDEKNLKEGA